MTMVAGTPTRITNNYNIFEIFGPITLSGNAVATPGDTLSFAGLVASNSLPDSVQLLEQPVAGQAASGCDIFWSPGTTQANGTVQVFKSAAQQTGSYASLGIVSLYYLARFVKFQ